MKTENKISLGIDIGGTNLKAVAVELPGYRVIEEYEQPSGAQECPDAVRNSIRCTVDHFKRNGLDSRTLGIGCAGSVEPQTGIVRNSPNFKNWKNIPLKAWVLEDSHIPTVVDNDANCAAHTEWKLGAGQGFSNVLVLTLGTGIGGGLIIDNHLFRGATGTGGEVGHYSIYADGKDCPCGNRGCFERYCSASAVETQAPGLSTKQVFERNNCDPLCRGIIDRFLADFKIGLTSLANVFDPDIIVLVGGVSLGLTRYLEEIHEWLRKHAFPAVGSHVQLTIGKFGNLSGAIGASLIAADQL